MNGRGSICLLVLLLCQSLPAQQPMQQIRQAEDFESQLATAPPESEHYQLPEEELLEQEAACRSLDLNTALPSALEASGLFSPYQLFHFLEYRDRYGPLFSWYELHALPGFDASTIAALSAAAYLSASQSPPGKDGHRQQLLLQARRTFPSSEGYLLADSLEKAYAGGPWRSVLRYRFQGSRLDMGICHEKDGGESLRAPASTHLSGYIRARSRSGNCELLLGDYRIHSGLGLVSGSSFMQGPGSMKVHHGRLLRLMPVCSSAEYGYSHGAAIILRSGKLELLCWASSKPFDLSIERFREEDTRTWWAFRKQNGLYRSEKELQARGLGLNQQAGCQLQLRKGPLTSGLQLAYQRTSSSPKGLELNSTPSAPYHRPICSVYGNLIRNSLQVYSELAISWDPGPGHALLAGLEYHFSPFLSTGLLAHSFSQDFSGLHPAAYSLGQRSDRQQGLALHLRLHAGSLMLVQALLEYRRMLLPSHQRISPTACLRSSLSFSSAALASRAWKIELMHRKDEVHLRREGQPAYAPQDRSLLQLRLMFSQKVAERLRIQARMSLGKCPAASFPPSRVVLLELAYRDSRKRKMVLQASNFHIPDWNARIYLYEPGFRYDLNFALFHGRGQKLLLLAEMPLSKRIGLGARLLYALYMDTGQTGSGTETRAGPEKWECGLELRARL